MIIPKIHSKRFNGMGTNPKSVPMDVYGNTTVIIIVHAVIINKDLPGILLKKDNRVRITSTTNQADITDSVNHAV